jgi:hypothetical protein
VLTAAETRAIGRKSGLFRVAFVVAHDQHGSVKVNSGIEIVKINFSNGRRRWKFRWSFATEFSPAECATSGEGTKRLRAATLWASVSGRALRLSAWQTQPVAA